MNDEILIILPVHNRKDITSNFVCQLKRQTYDHYRLIVIDDGSTDGTAEMLHESFPDATILRGNGDLWWAGSLQLAFNWLRAQSFPSNSIVLIVNDDVYINTDFLERATLILKERSKTLLAPYAYYSETKQINDPGVCADWRRLTFNHAVSKDEINCLSTRALFLRLADFIFVGGFHPKLLPHYLSDYEFTMRARAKGMTLTAEPSLKLFISEHTTGFDHACETSFFAFQKKLFSRKSMLNPFAWFFFVALACPWRWKFINWLRIFERTVILEIRQLVNGINRLLGKGAGNTICR